MDSTVVIEPAYNALSDVRALFEAYTAMLVTHDPAFQIYLDIQHYADELRAPAAKYQPLPRFPSVERDIAVVARVDGRAAGCIALRRLDGERCEMKRLYVQPQYRGRGLARQLIRRITEDARQIGYRCMLLDTLPVLEDAVRLYRQLGFYEIPCYNDSPVESTLFFQLDL